MAYSLFLALAPALLAITAALVTRRVVVSLALGVLAGALIAAPGVLDVPGLLIHFVADAVAPGLADGEPLGDIDTSHLVVTGFSLLVAGMIGVLGKSGATRALVGLVERVARGRRGAMVASWLAGIVVFFDDYANCLVVGGAMGSLCDRFRVSRAKLAYIVDSTAAPIASLALVSTWVGYEVSLIHDSLVARGSDVSAFSVFVGALPYRFYGIFTLAFVGAVVFSGRDFGPMRRAEEAALAEPHLPPSVSSTQDSGRWWAAALPILALVVVTLGWMVWDGVSAQYAHYADLLTPIAADLGRGEQVSAHAWTAVSETPWFAILGKADPFWAMLWGSLAAFVLALVLATVTRAAPPAQLPGMVFSGLKPVGEALVVLFLAWSLGNAMSATHAADLLGLLLSDQLPASAFPAIVFLLAAGTAFATGTSFGTMAILIPLAVETSLIFEPSIGPIVYASTGAVLAGACLGDHASPISDTTVLSALGASVDVVTHVRTQLPYALCTGGLSVAIGYIPVGLGAPVWVVLPLGIAAAIGILLVFGKVPRRGSVTG